MPRRARPRRTRRPTSAANSMLSRTAVARAGASFFRAAFLEFRTKSTSVLSRMHNNACRIIRKVVGVGSMGDGTPKRARARGAILTFSYMSTSLDIWNQRMPSLRWLPWRSRPGSMSSDCWSSTSQMAFRRRDRQRACGTAQYHVVASLDLDAEHNSSPPYGTVVRSPIARISRRFRSAHLVSAAGLLRR